MGLTRSLEDGNPPRASGNLRDWLVPVDKVGRIATTATGFKISTIKGSNTRESHGFAFWLFPCLKIGQ